MTQLRDRRILHLAVATFVVVLAPFLTTLAHGAPRTETRTFMAIGPQERNLSFRLADVKPTGIRRARLVAGRRTAAVSLAAARRGARRGVLRLPLSVLGAYRGRARAKPPTRHAKLVLTVAVSREDKHARRDAGVPHAGGSAPAVEDPPRPVAGDSGVQAPPPSGVGAAAGSRDGRGSALAGVKLYVEADSPARRQADAWRLHRPLDAAHMDRIAAEPQAEWLGGWSGDIRAAVSESVSVAVAAGEVPVLVAYNIPQRDCGSHSAGGAASTAAYRTWIGEFAAGIGGRPAIVVLEPDALAGIDCLTSDDGATRLALLEDAVSVLASHGSVATYVDAGHSAWQSPEVIAARLNSVGISRAQGFSLNVSNFRPTGEEIAYGHAIAKLTGDKHFIVDTSRNGSATASKEWCNPTGRALGPVPTTDPGQPLVDAYLWVKRPGESDGSCNGGPPAGAWWPEYALGMAQRAG